MPTPRKDLKIVGNGAAERARKALVDRNKKQKSRLDEILGASNTALGIKPKKSKEKTR